MTPARPNRRYQIALWLDRSVGPVACGALALAKRFRKPRASAGVRRVLVVKFWGIGSLVLASPLFAEIVRRHPGARIDVVTLRANEAILRFYPQVSQRLTVDLDRGVLRFLRETAALVWRVRRERYDLVLDLEFFTRFSAIFSFLARGTRSHGFSSKGSARGRLHDVEVPFSGYRHVVSNFLSLLRAAPQEAPVDPDVERDLVLPPIAAGEDARARCARALESHAAYHPDRSLVVVNPNAGDMALERRWPADRVAALLVGLVSRRDANVVLTGAPAEAAYVASVAAGSGVADRLIDLSGQLSIEELVALLGRADVFVTNDSGPLHIACAAGASTAALFGPETPVLYGPLRSREGQRHRVHYRGLGCSPCMFVHDNKVLSCWFAQAECMSQIPPADVLASVASLLTAPDPGVAARRRASA